VISIKSNEFLNKLYGFLDNQRNQGTYIIEFFNAAGSHYFVMPLAYKNRTNEALEGERHYAKDRPLIPEIKESFPNPINLDGLAAFIDKNLPANKLTTCMIFDNSEFGYWNVTVERPLRLRVFPEREIPEDTFKKQSELDAVREAIAKIPAGTPLDDWDAFAKATKLKKTQLKKIRPFITETDPHAKEVEGESDPNLRDSENIPFNYDGGIDAFIEKEVKPYAPDAYVDESKTRIGYEISFTKYFYKPVQLRDMKDILASLEELERESDGVMSRSSLRRS
jgi:hypothetical protein